MVSIKVRTWQNSVIIIDGNQRKKLQKPGNLTVVKIIFALQQEWNSYKHLQQQIAETDLQIDQLLKEFIDKDDHKKQHTIEKKAQAKKQKCGKPNGYKFSCLPILRRCRSDGY